MSKLAKIFISTIILAMLLASCAAPTATPAPPQVTVVAQTQIVNQTQIVQQTQIVEKVVTATPAPTQAPDKIRMWLPGGQTNVADWKFDPVLNVIEQKTNTQIDVTFYDWGTYVDKLNAAAADGTFPDLVGVIDHTQRSIFAKWIDSGVIAPFEGDVAAAAPLVLKEYQDDPNLTELKVNGKIYFQPVGWETGRAPNMGLIHVRKDLLDKYNMQPPETFDDYFAYVKTCMQKGDGKGIVFAGKSGIGPAINAFAGAFGLPFRGWVKQADGSFGYWAVQPDIKGALQLFRKMVADGLVDPASWTLDDGMPTWLSGTDCSYIFNGGGHVGRIQVEFDKAKKGFQEYMLPALLNPTTGKRGYTAEEMFWGVSTLGNLKGDNPVAAARVMNYLLSDEGLKLTAVGIEGRDYTEQNGQITLLPQRSMDGFGPNIAEAGFHPLDEEVVNWTPMKWQNWQIEYGQPQSFIDWYNAMWQNQIKYQIQTYGIDSTTDKWNAFQATGEDTINRAFIAAVKAPSDDAAGKIFDKFVSDWMNAGGKDASAEMSAYLQTLFK